MPTTKKAARTGAKSAAKKATKNAAKASAARMTLQDAMAALERAGSAQTRKTYARHGAPEPMFGTSFATLKVLYKRIGVDQELAEALWNTGNFDARNLAVKIADPRGISSRELDRWAASPTARMCGSYVAYLAAEGPHARDKAEKWLASSDDPTRSAGWSLVGAMAMIDESTPESWFTGQLARIEKGIGAASSTHRYLMNQALISIGGRSASLRKAAGAVARRIGKVEVDHGDTDCKTPDALEYMEKSWARAKTGGFESPAAHERSRESMRTRC